MLHAMRWLAALLFLALPLPAEAACPPPAAGTALVVDVGEGGRLTLDDGRVVVIAGLAPEAGTEDDLAALVVGEHVTLRPLTPATDRWGRLLAEVDLPDGTSVAAILIGKGLGHAAAVGRSDCLATLLAAEAGARAAALGVWRKPGYVLSAQDAAALAHRVGEHVVVAGRAISARLFGGRVYVNFAHRRDQGLSVVVRRRDWSRNGLATAAALSALRGRRLRVRGHLEWHGGPLIELTGEEPVERLD
ncbi:MAG TPA: thermonuclease family protein [Hyphomicrobiales bacterium]|nr:thermonuclease family protein [Hyphomicrobiales bacterium]